jgi:pimeloyl-ACP methyl ester carboxylesterase
MGKWTRRRKEHFESRDELIETVSRSRAFRRIPPGALELFGQTTLRPSLSGGYELCCPAEYEAQIYEYLFGWAMRMYQDLERDNLSCPVKAIGSDPTVPYSFMPAMDLSKLTMMNYDFIPESTHFLPLEFPEECAAITVEFLEEHGLA